MAIKVLIYQDYVHNNGLLYKSLNLAIPNCIINYIDANEIISRGISDDITVFIMPGGAPRMMFDKLKENGNGKIHNYIKSGGIYIGICGGAYYACKEIKWSEKEDTTELISNTLNLCNIIAHGPIVEKKSFKKILDHTKVNIHVSLNEEYCCYYTGGPTFKEINEDQNILAYYHSWQSDMPAVVEGGFGNGKYILIGPHLEVCTNGLELKLFSFPSYKTTKIEDMDKKVGLHGIENHYFKNLLQRYCK